MDEEEEEAVMGIETSWLGPWMCRAGIPYAWMYSDLDGLKDRVME
jgi:hypothetical protein